MAPLGHEQDCGQMDSWQGECVVMTGSGTCFRDMQMARFS